MTKEKLLLKVTGECVKKHAMIFASILIMVAGFAWDLSHGNTWRDLFWPDHWRHPLRDLMDLGIASVLLVYWLVDFVIPSHKKRIGLKAKVDWYRRLDAVVDIDDFNERDHLYGYLEPNQRQMLICELQRMTQGSRSLRKAVQIVSPELIDD